MPAGLAALLDAMLSELEDHMVREERVLSRRYSQAAAGAFAMRKMRLEHDVHQTHLAELSAYPWLPLPPDACGSWRALYQGCKKLSDDLRRHIAIEKTKCCSHFTRRRLEACGDRAQLMP